MTSIPIVYPDVANWWYHYYSQGENRQIGKLDPTHFALSNDKCTPDFANYVYDYGICHPQIGVDVTDKKSIVLMKTTVGCSNPKEGNICKSPYIVGYFRVDKADRKHEIVHIDPSDSLLLLGDPVKLDCALAERLFLGKQKGYWANSDLFVRRLGSTLRNRRARAHEVATVLQELSLRKEGGALNYFGGLYNKLLCGASKR